MPNDVVISVENLSKRYRIGLKEEMHDTFTAAITSWIKSPLANYRRLRRLTTFEDNMSREQGARSLPLPADLLRAPCPMPSSQDDVIWALRDVSFEVKQGEIIGIIGRNGAGKSTLLKILSRITEPTSGRAGINGRVSSLLEVGTGFHPDLTGRENIYLNGTVLGMTKAEIDGKFDEIVDFAEVKKFIDTPVKRYSSGMQVRLAFAVAAHLEPEILLVDEVLAVGDAAFQKKCLGKMGTVAREGRTVLFVSHNMNAIASICRRCLFIKKGALCLDGNASEVVALYQSESCSVAEDTADLSKFERYGTGKARFMSLMLTPLSSDGRPQPVLRVGGGLKVEVTIAAVETVVEANVAIIIYATSGYRLIDANTALKDKFLNLKPGQGARVWFILHNVLLRPDTYLLGLWIGRTNVEDIDGITYATSFLVETDLEACSHPTVFPGVYQCEYTHGICVEEGMRSDWCANRKFPK